MSSEKSPLKRQSLSPEAEADETASITSAETSAVASESVPEELDERLRVALTAASDKKAVRLTVLDLRGVAGFTDFFVIASGTNQRQVQAITDAIEETLRKQLRVRPARIEGYSAAEWILLDYGDIVMHIFLEEARQFYDLERLWREARRVPLPPELNEQPIIITLRSDA